MLQVREGRNASDFLRCESQRNLAKSPGEERPGARKAQRREVERRMNPPSKFEESDLYGFGKRSVSRFAAEERKLSTLALDAARNRRAYPISQFLLVFDGGDVERSGETCASSACESEER